MTVNRPDLTRLISHVEVEGPRSGPIPIDHANRLEKTAARCHIHLPAGWSQDRLRRTRALTELLLHHAPNVKTLGINLNLFLTFGNIDNWSVINNPTNPSTQDATRLMALRTLDVKPGKTIHLEILGAVLRDAPNLKTLHLTKVRSMSYVWEDLSSVTDLTLDQRLFPCRFTTAFSAPALG